MENDVLNNLWERQAHDSLNVSPKAIIDKAKKQRMGQYISITVMSVTALILLIYMWYFAFNPWNTFNLGLMLMISSLTFRIILEFYSLFRREKRIISMAQKYYQNYLKKYYKTRAMINYVITPVCMATYIFGFYLLLPYFKEYFPKAFYMYILISGILSFVVVIGIIVRSMIKEHHLLKQLKTR